MKREIKWSLKIGDVIKTEYKDLIIIDKKFEKGKQLYKIKCNKCGFQSEGYYKSINGERAYFDEYWTTYNSLKKQKYCPCCSKQKKIIVKGINDIPTTAPWMVKYFQGGYDEAVMYSNNSGEKIYPICPDCNDIKSKPIAIYQIYNEHKISCHCQDGISIPNKIAYYSFKQISNMLDEYKREYQPLWTKPYYYDNFIKIQDRKYIIEMDGGFHNKDNNLNGQKLDQIKNRDLIKETLAKEHNIALIRVDCDYVDIEDIKINFINALSEIKEIDMSLINWKDVFINVSSNLIKEISLYYKETGLDTKEIANIYMMHNDTVRKYLKIGNKCGWCNYVDKYMLSKQKRDKAINIRHDNQEITVKELSDIIGVNSNSIRRFLKYGTEQGLCYYDPKEEILKNNKKLQKDTIERCSKTVCAYTQGGDFIGQFKNSTEVIDFFNKNFNVVLYQSNISKVCLGERKHTKSFVFRYEEKEI